MRPDGVAAGRDEFPVDLTPAADLPGIAAAAGGAWGRTVRVAAELPEALAEALRVVRAGRSAVLAVRVPGVGSPGDGDGE